MSAASIRRLLRSALSHVPCQPRPRAFLGVEGLSERIVPTVTASMPAQVGELAMVADATSEFADARIDVDPTVGGSGNDALVVETVPDNGVDAAARASVSVAPAVGGSGNDALVGGAVRDNGFDDAAWAVVSVAPAVGGSGNDALIGGAGRDYGFDFAVQAADAATAVAVSNGLTIETSPSDQSETSSARRSSVVLDDIVVVIEIDKSSPK